MEPMSVIESDGSERSLKPVTGCKRVEVSRGVSFAFFFIGFLLCIVAFGTPWWFHQGDDSFGLWNTCGRDFFSGEMGCERIIVGRPSPLSFDMRALQANMTLALLANGICFVMYMIWFCNKIRKGSRAFITIGLLLFAGIAQVTAVAMFGVFYKTDTTVLGWSFIIACASGGIQTLTGLITIFVLPFVR